MYEKLIGELHFVASGVQSKRRRGLLEQAADAIDKLSKLAEAIPNKCNCCIGCEIEQEDGGCETGFVLSPERAKAYIEENLDWWRKFRALMEAMGTPIPEPPKEETK